MDRITRNGRGDGGGGDFSAMLESLLRKRLGHQIPDLRVTLQNEGVVLRGHTRTYYAKQLAQHAVMDVTERPIIANLIEVS